MICFACRGLVVGLEGDYEGGEVVVVAGEVVGKSMAGASDVCRCGTVAKVTVDHEHPSVFECERHGKVHGEEGLATAGIEGCDGKDIASLLVDTREIGVCAEHTESLVDNVACTAFHHDFRFMVFLILLAAKLGNLTKHRDGEIFNVLASAHFSIEVSLT